MSNDKTEDRRSLPAVLGLWDAVAFVVGSIIGSGIFLKASTVAGELRYFGPILAVWIVIGFVTLCGSLALAELAAMLPQAGGPYVYLRESFGRMPAFLWGWTEFWVVRTGSLGALASATVIYLNSVVPIPGKLHGPTAAFLIIALTLVNWRSTRWGTTIQNVTTVIKVGFLLLLISLPLLMGKVDVANLYPLWPEQVNGDFWRSIGVAAIAVMWPYDGWITIGPIAEEIRQPQRNIPLALTLGMAIVIFVYVAANTIYHLVLPMDKVIASKAVAGDVFAILLGGVGIPLAALGVMCSTFGATQSNLLTGPRIYFAMARDNLLPHRLAEVHSTYATPGNSVLLQGAWASALVLIAYARNARSESPDPKAAFEFLTVFVVFGGSIFYSLAIAAVFVLRWRLPNLPRPYRTWGYPWTPAIYLITYALVISSTVREKWQESASVGVLVLAGVAFYFWRSKR